MNRQALIACAGFAGWILILTTASLMAQPVGNPPKHDLTDKNHWYDMYCCDRRDCRAATDDEVEQVKGGYLVLGEYFVKGNSTQVRPSRDARYHFCLAQGEAFGYGEDRKKADDWVRCLYIPALY